VSNKVSNVLFELCERTEREREAHRSTLLSFGGGVINAVKNALVSLARFWCTRDAAV